MEEHYLASKYDIQEIRGQCYDGASNMASYKKALSGRTLQKNKKEIYTHYNSHAINFSIAGTLKSILL